MERTVPHGCGSIGSAQFHTDSAELVKALDQSQSQPSTNGASPETGAAPRPPVIAWRSVTEELPFDMGALLQTNGLAAVLKTFADAERNPLAELKLDSPNGVCHTPVACVTSLSCESFRLSLTVGFCSYQ